MKYKYTITNEKNESKGRLWGNISSKFKKKFGIHNRVTEKTSYIEADNIEEAKAIARRHISKFDQGYRLGSIHEVEG